MPDTYQNFGGGAVGAFAITPSDTVNHQVTRAIWVGGTGNISVLMMDGTSAVFTAVAASTNLPWPMRVRRVNATSTTATGLIGLL